MSSDSRTLNSGRNAMYNVACRMIVFFITFLNRRLFVQFLGVDYLGIDGLFSNIINILSLADLGLGITISYSLYKPLAEKDKQKLSELLTFYKNMYNIIALVVFVLGCSLIPFLKYIVNVDRDIPYLELYYFIILLNTVVSYLFVYRSSIITADQKGYIVVKYNTIINILKLIAQAIILVLLKNFVVYIISNVVWNLINNLYITHIADKMYPFIKNKAELPKSEKREIFKTIKAAVIYKTSFAIVGGMDNLIISAILSTSIVGYYSNYYMLSFWLMQTFVLIIDSFIPSVGNLVVNSDSNKRYEVFSAIHTVCFWAYANITVLFFCTSGDVVTLWLGKGFVLGVFTVAAISMDIFVTGCTRAMWLFRDATGMFRKLRYVMVAAAIINLVLSVALGKLIGLAGIILATSISKLCTYFIYEPILMFKMFFDRSPAKYFKDFVVNAAIVFAICALGQQIFSKFEFNQLLMFVVKSGICIVIVNTIYFLLYRKTCEFNYIRSQVNLMLSKLLHR